MQSNKLLIVFATLASLSCSALELSEVPLARDGLPTAPDVAEYFAATDTLNLADPEFTFADGSGGMSINLEFSGRGLRGDFLSVNADGRGDNNSGNPEGQILAYNLSRILGYSASYGRGRWSEISGYPVQALAQLAAQNRTSHRIARESRERILQTTQSSVVRGSVSVYGPKPYDLTVLEDSSSGNNGLFKSTAPFAALIRADGPRAQNRIVTLGRYNMNELETAKTLSTIFVIDALTEQWDRFSGGNISVVKSGDIYRMVAYDNGGAGISGWGSSYVTRYLTWTSRFDRDVASRVLALDAFMSGKTPSFLGFTNVADLNQALGLRKFTNTFKRSLAKVAAHIRATAASRGEAAYF